MYPKARYDPIKSGTGSYADVTTKGSLSAPRHQVVHIVVSGCDQNLGMAPSKTLGKFHLALSPADVSSTARRERDTTRACRHPGPRAPRGIPSVNRPGLPGSAGHCFGRSQAGTLDEAHGSAFRALGENCGTP